MISNLVCEAASSEVNITTTSLYTDKHVEREQHNKSMELMEHIGAESPLFGWEDMPIAQNCTSACELMPRCSSRRRVRTSRASVFHISEDLNCTCGELAREFCDPTGDVWNVHEHVIALKPRTIASGREATGVFVHLIGSSRTLSNPPPSPAC